MYKRPTLQPGDWFVVDDQSGFRVPASQARFQWNNLLVWDPVWENRQPQDYLRGIPDDQSVPYARPMQAPTFLNRTVTPGEL